MAGASTDFKGLLLLCLQEEAEQAGITLAAALKALRHARFDEIKTGSVLIGASGNGSSVSFAIPSSGSRLTPESVAIAAFQLHKLYQEAVSELGAEEAGTTSAAIAARMQVLLVPMNEVYSDRSGVAA